MNKRLTEKTIILVILLLTNFSDSQTKACCCWYIPAAQIVQFPGNAWTDQMYNLNAMQVALDTSIFQMCKCKYKLIWTPITATAHLKSSIRISASNGTNEGTFASVSKSQIS